MTKKEITPMAVNKLLSKNKEELWQTVKQYKR